MKPQLGDTISNRYVLVSPLREETGLQVWKASDHVLARDCQLFIVNNRKALSSVNAAASMLAISHDAHFTQVLQLQHAGEVALVITQLDGGISLDEYLTSASLRPLSYDAMRSIVGEVVEALHVLQKDNLTHFSISTDTVRLTRSGVEIADAPVSSMLVDLSRAQSLENQEQLAIRQVAALLYAMLTRQPSTLSTDFRLDALPHDVPMEFRVICKRGLELDDTDGFPTVPMATLAELEALLDDYRPLKELTEKDVTIPSVDSECSIVDAPLLQVLDKDLIALPDNLAETGSVPEMTFEAPRPHSDLSDSKEALAKGVAATSGAVKSWWNSGRELLSEEDIDGVIDDDDSPFSFPIRVSVPSVDGSSDNGGETQVEKTGRIPVIGPDGRVIQPGEESARALKAEQEAIDAAYEAGNGAVPPSFTPKNGSSNGTEVANARLFGKLKTKVVAIIIAFLVVAVAASFAVRALVNDGGSGSSSSNSNSPWPEMNLDAVPFGQSDDSKNSSDSSDTSGNANGSQKSDDSDSKKTDTSKKQSASKKTDASKKSDDSKKPSAKTDAKKSSKKQTDKVVTSDKKVKKVPSPKEPENNTAYEIDNRQFVTNPDGEQGYGYAVHLSQPQKVHRMSITIRTSGGQGYVRVNTTSNPNEGEQVAQFEFDASGTTNVKFNKTVETQDVFLWVPINSLPGNQLYIDAIQIY